MGRAGPAPIGDGHFVVRAPRGNAAATPSFIPSLDVVHETSGDKARNA
jgi:hypothetical protein